MVASNSTKIFTMIPVIAVVDGIFVYVEAPEERLERLKKVNEGILARANIFDCLMEATGVSVTRISRVNPGPGRTHTPRSIHSPAKIAFAGGKG